jgi:hypothetical protein
MTTKMKMLEKIFLDEQVLNIPMRLRFHKTKAGKKLFKEALKEEEDNAIKKGIKLWNELKQKYPKP